MAELVALFIVWKNIGAIARAGGLAARRFQTRAIVLWILFECAGGFLAGAMGMREFPGYLAAFAGALISLHFSFSSVRLAVEKKARMEKYKLAPQSDEPSAPPQNP